MDDVRQDGTAVGLQKGNRHLEEFSSVLVVHYMGNVGLCDSVPASAFVNASAGTTDRPWQVSDAQLQVPATERGPIRSLQEKRTI